MKQVKTISKCLLVLLLMAPIVALGQDQGIRFVQGMTWQQIKDKAKAEHKYIFVDCYATWCGPCKQMDANVYPDKAVGNYYNSHFISVKLQMDKAPDDEESVKAWYGIAAALDRTYTINAFPTFLFFDSDGKAVHKVTGSEGIESFIQTGKDAMDTSRQYYAIFKNFQLGKLDTAEEKGLARAFTFSDRELASKIALDYLTRIPKKQLANADNGELMVRFEDDPEILNIAIDQIKRTGIRNNLNLMAALDKQKAVHELSMAYLHQLNFKLGQKKNLVFMEQIGRDSAVKVIAKNYIRRTSFKELLTTERIVFTAVFTDTSSGKGFDLFFTHGAEVDTVMHDTNYAKNVIDRLVSREQVDPVYKEAVRNGNEPNWSQIENHIIEKFGAVYIKPAILYAKANWYITHKDTIAYTKYFVELTNLEIASLIKKKDYRDLNEFAWRVFNISENNSELIDAAEWSKEAVYLCPDNDLTFKANLMDTRANLLYKLRKKDEALALEKKAMLLDPKNKDIAGNYEKMQEGIPTWPAK